MANIQIFLSDTHFGVRNNSINWLQSQKDFIYNQFVPYLKKLEKDNTVEVFHLGDVFDSRSSISPMICKEANKMLETIACHCDLFTILAGNHDFFSPIEGSDNSTSLEMLPCMWRTDIDNIEILTEGCSYIDSEIVCIPWFEFHNPKKLKSILDRVKNIKTILTHTDLDHLDPEIQKIVGDRNIVTGHIHIPDIDEKHHHYTLGSCYSLNFADSNADRGFWRIDNWDLSTLEFIENTESIKFYRINVDDLFSEPTYNPQDYIELIVKEDVYNRDSTQEAIKGFYSRYPHFTVVVEENELEYDKTPGIDLGIYPIVKSFCPKHLHDKLDEVVESITNA